TATASGSPTRPMPSPARSPWRAASFSVKKSGVPRTEYRMPHVDDLKVKIFADGADLGFIARMARDPLVRGFTTNPTLMHKAGVRNSRDFARKVIEPVPDLPISFEVFSDDFEEMERQALEIASWGANVFVKVPVTNTRGEFSGGLIG